MLVVTLTGCTTNDDLDTDAVHVNAIEMKGFEAVVEDMASQTGTRIAALADKVGRSEFVSGDQAVFTSIKRTTNPIEYFTYSDVTFTYNGSQWNKVGDNLYWSDATSEHTFIGYSLPHGTFDWTLSGESYIGTIGNGEAGESVTFSSLDDLKNEDLLITYSTTMTANTGSVPLVSFHHALGSVRVVVSIINGASSDARVTEMTLLHQPTKYVWDKTSWNVSPIAEESQARKNLQLCIPTPEGTTSGANKEFTFYGMVIPQSSAYLSSLTTEDYKKTEIEFKVTYTSSTSTPTTRTYKASSTSGTAYFDSGNNTTIKINVTL
jgi:hypothetical protein